MEDNAALRAAICAQAKKSGWFSTVTTAGDGQRAVELFVNGAAPADGLPPDVVLTNLYLPGMNGAELIREVRRQPGGGSVPCIVFSSYDSPIEREAAHQAGCNSFVLKPTSAGEIDALLSLVVTLARAARAERGGRRFDPVVGGTP